MAVCPFTLRYSLINSQGLCVCVKSSPCKGETKHDTITEIISLLFCVQLYSKSFDCQQNELNFLHVDFNVKTENTSLVP